MFCCGRAIIVRQSGTPGNCMFSFQRRRWTATWMDEWVLKVKSKSMLSAFKGLFSFHAWLVFHAHTKITQDSHDSMDVAFWYVLTQWGKPEGGNVWFQINTPPDGWNWWMCGKLLGKSRGFLKSHFPLSNHMFKQDFSSTDLFLLDSSLTVNLALVNTRSVYGI